MAQELIWAGIQWAAGRLDAKNVIKITMEGAGEGAQVLIGPVADLSAGDAEAAVSIATDAMKQALQAELSLDTASAMLRIHLAPLQAPP
jgi:hypothetical protein